MRLSTYQKWKPVVDDFHQSGLSLKEYAMLHDVSYSRLYHWVRSFKCNTTVIEQKPVQPECTAVSSKPEFVEIICQVKSHV